MAHWYHSLAIACGLATCALGGSMSYLVTQNPGACHEVHLGPLTLSPQVSSYDDLNGSGYCHIEIRAAGEMDLYLAAACQFDTPHSQTFPLTREKYAVDISQPNKVRRIDDQAWQQAEPLVPGQLLGNPPVHPTDRGISFKGRLFEKSGPRWSGVGDPPIGAKFSSPNGSRVAVNSWDGFDVEYDFLDPTTAFQRGKVKGRFWTDIYDTQTGEGLIRIEGSFNGVGPHMFLGPARWYGWRYFVMPVGHTALLGYYSLRRLLICDADAAEHANGSRLKERK